MFSLRSIFVLVILNRYVHIIDTQKLFDISHCPRKVDKCVLEFKMNAVKQAETKTEYEEMLIGTTRFKKWATRYTKS